MDKLAEKFARVNFDDVVPVYEEALTLFKEGKVNEAIAVLEATNPAQRTKQIIAEEKRIEQAEIELDSQKVALAREKKQQIATVRLLADMYSVSFDPIKAEQQYDQLLALDSTNLEILRDAEEFFREQHLYEKAFQLNPKIVQNQEAEDWQIANAFVHLGELYTTTGKLEKAMFFFSNATFVYDTLASGTVDDPFFKQNLAVSYSKLGETYTSLGSLDSALVLFSRTFKTRKSAV